MTTEERLDVLELQLATARRCNRWMVLMLGLALVGAHAIGCARNGMGLSDAKGMIRAKGFVVVDSAGRARAMLIADGGAAGLRVADEKGETRAGMMVDQDGLMLGLMDEQGKLFWTTPAE